MSGSHLKRSQSNVKFTFPHKPVSSTFPTQWMAMLRAASTFSAFYLPSTDGTKCHDLSFLNAEFQANFFTFLFHLYQATFLGFPGSSAGKESACSAGDLV